MKDLVTEVLKNEKELKTPCPNCGVAISHVVTVNHRSDRNSKYPGTRRRRLCGNCGTGFSTIEILDTKYKRLINDYKTLLIFIKSIVEVINEKEINKLLSQLGENVEDEKS